MCTLINDINLYLACFRAMQELPGFEWGQWPVWTTPLLVMKTIVIPEGPSGAIEQLPVANLRKERLFRDQLDPLQVPDELLLR